MITSQGAAYPYASLRFLLSSYCMTRTPMTCIVRVATGSLYYNSYLQQLRCTVRAPCAHQVTLYTARPYSPHNLKLCTGPL